ncbi:MAG: sulfatase [Planctomycetota bacterium]
MALVLASALSAAAVGTVLFGTIDAFVAARSTQISVLAFLGCWAATLLTYSAIWIPLCATIALVLAPMLVRRGVADARARMISVAIALGLFCEIYWWTRPYVFYGRSSVSIERIGAAACMAIASLLVAAVLVRLVRDQLPRYAAIAAFVMVGAWVGGAAYLVLHGNAIAARGTIHERNRELPNVLLVIVDALRQDVLGCYGHARVKTPAIDALARRGVVFENAFVQAPFTWTSFGSLLTGKYPRRHGLIKMAPGERMEPNVTLPYHLKTATKRDGTALTGDDVLAASFHTGTLSEGSGLLRGFDMLFEATAGHELVVLDDPWSVFRAHLLLSIFRQKINQRFDSGIVASAARRWLEASARKRFVAMVHLYSTHTPYDPPDEFRRMYCDPNYTGPVKAFYAQHRELIEDGAYTPTEADVAQIQNLYYAGVTQADRLIGELVGDLERAGVLDDTLVIVTSDHGESLGEQGLWEHNHMAQTNLRVPLVMSWPPKLPANTRVKALVDQIDVFPTTCELAGLELPAAATARDHVDGASLLPLVRGEVERVRRYSFAENGTHSSIQDERWKLVIRRRYLRAKDAASAVDCWKKSFDREGEQPVLYDLIADPSETRDRSRAEPETAEALFRALYDWSSALPIATEKNVLSHRDEQTRQNLTNLGYTGDGVGGDDDEEDPCAAEGAASAGGR